MANRREEERERLRQLREERQTKQSKSGRARLVIGYAAAATVGLAVVVGIVIAVSSGGSDGGGAHIDQASGSTNGVEPDDRDGIPPEPIKVTNVRQAAKQAECDLRLGLEDEGHGHISASAPTPTYKTSPPTSGNHTEPPYQQADGAYSETPREIYVIHALEHGRMAIQYDPELSEEDQLELKGLYDTMYGGTLLLPNSTMDYAIAAATWTNLLGCDEYKGAITLDAIRSFGKLTWGRFGGEPVNAFSVTGPTPKAPQS